MAESFNAREGLGWFVTIGFTYLFVRYGLGFNAREGLGWFVTGISSSTTTGEPRLFCFNAREGLGWFVTRTTHDLPSAVRDCFNAREGLGWFVTCQ